MSDVRPTRKGGGVKLEVWLLPSEMERLTELADSLSRTTAAEARAAILRHLAQPPRLDVPALAPAPPVEVASQEEDAPATTGETGEEPAAKKKSEKRGGKRKGNER